MPQFEAQPHLHGFEALPMTDGDFHVRTPREHIRSVSEFTYDLRHEATPLDGFEALDDLQRVAKALHIAGMPRRESLERIA